ncbi:hypothetical protein [Streptomyces sp. NPDC045470]|uniref:hypothetical protein n=1 Tax=unclassified Streptomyces TaxID=2593676 RepID=UPI0033F373AC
MIVSFRLADVGLRAARDVPRSRPRPGSLPGLRHARTALTGDSPPVRRGCVPDAPR